MEVLYLFVSGYRRYRAFACFCDSDGLVHGRIVDVKYFLVRPLCSLFD